MAGSQWQKKESANIPTRRISGRSNCLSGTGQNLPSFSTLVLRQDNRTYSSTQVIGLAAKANIECDFAE